MNVSRYDPLVDSTAILGSTFVDHLNGTDPRWAVLTIGKERYTKHRLVREFGTGNFQAARRLSKAVKKLGLDSIDDLYNVPPNQLAAMKDFGITTLYVLICIFTQKGKSIDRWYDKNDPSFHQLKAIQREDSRHSEHEEARAKKRNRLKATATAIIKRRGPRAARSAHAS